MQATLSPTSVIGDPKSVNPQYGMDKSVSLPVANEAAIQTGKRAITDTVTISQQAIKMLGSDLEFRRYPPWQVRTAKDNK
jgi:hypothetical protein